jgi:hypothetical protein
MRPSPDTSSGRAFPRPSSTESISSRIRARYESQMFCPRTYDQFFVTPAEAVQTLRDALLDRVDQRVIYQRAEQL